MDDVDPAAVARLREVLAVVPSLRTRREAALRAEPPADSLAAADLALDGGRLVTVYAGQALNGAVDDLNAWRLLADGTELPLRAHMVLLRAALEASVRARWLVDPSAGAGERVGRAWAMRRRDQQERANFEASLPDGGASLHASMGPKGRTGAQRVAEVDDPAAVRAREAAGVRTVGFASATALFTHYRLEHVYRLLSGLTHGFEWTLLTAQRLPADGLPATPGTGAGIFTMSEPVAVAMTELTAGAVRIAVDEFGRYRSGA